MATHKISVLIVDDSSVARTSLRKAIESDPDICVVDTARDGKEAIELVKKHKPDLVSLDIEMPVMDGRTALREILRLGIDPKPAVLMCSSLTTTGSREAIRALTEGASDFIAKPSGAFGSLNEVRDELVTKIKAIVNTRRPNSQTSHTQKGASTGSRTVSKLTIPDGRADIVCIASSTGGPPVLENVLKQLPADMAAPIIIAQHMPLMFTTSLAQRLNEVCKLNVVQGEDGMAITPGTVYIAPGGSHTRVKRMFGTLQLDISNKPANLVYKPSADELFRSSAEAANKPVLGIVLTGIGADGSEGAKTIKAKGGWIGAQNARTCVVYGMPRAVAEQKLTDVVGPADDLAAMVLAMGGPATGQMRKIA